MFVSSVTRSTGQLLVYSYDGKAEHFYSTFLL